MQFDQTEIEVCLLLGIFRFLRLDLGSNRGIDVQS